MSDSIYKQHRPGNSDDLYCKLLDGDKIKGRIVGEPSMSVYKQGDKPRYSWLIFVREKNGKPVNRPQILTKGISVYNGIADLAEDWGDPTEFDVAIKRTGSGLQDTEYSVTPVKSSPDLTKEELAEAEKINLVQATKGKWLRQFEEDRILPDPIVDFVPDEVAPMPEDLGEPVQITDEEMPEDFLK